MTDLRTRQFQISRALGKFITRLAATLTLERMPPFVSTSAVVIDNGRVLTIFDPIRREAVLPGGHLSWRETPQHAVVREVREETGYQIEPVALVGVFSGEEWADEPGVVRVIYTATVVGGGLRPSPEGVPSWVPLDQMLTSRTRDAPVLRYWRDQLTPA